MKGPMRGQGVSRKTPRGVPTWRSRTVRVGWEGGENHTVHFPSQPGKIDLFYRLQSIKLFFTAHPPFLIYVPLIVLFIC